MPMRRQGKPPRRGQGSPFEYGLGGFCALASSGVAYLLVAWRLVTSPRWADAG
jgi:hypothetical protein